MSKQRWKGGALLAPVPPVMVSCGTMANPNIITIAWTGIVSTIPPKTYISIRPERYSYDIIKNSGEFVINLTTKLLVKKADYCGVKTGAKCNKFKDMGLTPSEASDVSAPLIEESPINIECRVTNIITMGSHDMFLADIISVNVDEALIDEKGKLRMDKCRLVAFSHGEYFELGAKLGSFGYSVRKRK